MNNPEAEYWRNVALYLADCHAATGQGEALYTRTSKYSRKRFGIICEVAATMLGGTWPAAIRQHNDSDVERIRLRCLGASNVIKESLQ